MKVDMPVENMTKTNTRHKTLTESKKNQWLRAWEKSSFSDFNAVDESNANVKNKVYEDASALKAEKKQGQYTSNDISHGLFHAQTSLIAAENGKEEYIFTINARDRSEKAVLISTEMAADENEAIKKEFTSFLNSNKTVEILRGKPLNAMQLLQDVNVQIVIKNGLATIWIRDFKKQLDKTSLQNLLSHLKDSIEAKGYKISGCMLNAEIYHPNQHVSEEYHYGR